MNDTCNEQRSMGKQVIFYEIMYILKLKQNKHLEHLDFAKENQYKMLNIAQPVFQTQ